MLTRHHWRRSWVRGECLLVRVRVCVRVPYLMGPPEETPPSGAIAAPHKPRKNTEDSRRWSARSYLPLRKVRAHAILGHVLCHDSDDDLWFRLVPVVSAGEAKGKTLSVALQYTCYIQGNSSESWYLKLGESHQARGLTWLEEPLASFWPQHRATVGGMQQRRTGTQHEGHQWRGGRWRGRNATTKEALWVFFPPIRDIQ